MAGDERSRDKLDQIFILFTDWLVSFFPATFQPFGRRRPRRHRHHLCLSRLFALTVLLERKGLGRMQNRYGPNRVGPFGMFQPIADGIKSLTKEDVVPFNADAVVHFLAPVILVVAVFMGYAVLPVGRNMVLVDHGRRPAVLLRHGRIVGASVFMAGWSSRNKYSLLGAMRAVAQMISYEVPLLLSSVVVVMIAGSLSLPKIVEAQAGYTGVWPHWYVFTPWGFAGFIIFAHRRDSGNQPLALRSAGRRIGTRGRLLYRVLGLQVRHLLHRRISGHDFHLGARGHTVSGRLGGAVFVPDRGAVVVLVPCQSHGFSSASSSGCAPPCHACARTS